MLRDHLTALFRLYVNPPAALSQILDRGRLWFAALLALVVSYVLHYSDLLPRITFARPPLLTTALLRFLSFLPGEYLAPFAVLAIVVVPAIILVRALAGFGSFAVLLQSDYVTLLICVLMSWTAAYLPLTVLRLVIDTPWLDSVLPYAASNLCFFVLAALSVRTVFGTGLAAGFGMAAFGWVAGVFGGGLLAVIGPALYFLMSPFVLYFLYILFASDFRSFGDSLRSRQRMQQQLEISTNNPHDADAHYQLGLIYQKRRQYSEAITRFEKAAQIDPELADAHYQLGRIALEQDRFEDAIRHLKDAARIDDKLALSDVWRDLGAASLGAGRIDEAASALAKFTSRRPYDPEGLYWYGKTLVKMNQPAEARELFDRCMEAVRTMPSNRRAAVRKWASLAKTELRGIGS